PYGSLNAAVEYARTRRRRLSRRIETWRLRRAAEGSGRLLDMPCGAGRFAAFVSCDRSPGMVRLAKERSARVVRADAFALPFKSGSFDAALCVRLVHHFEADERRRALRELARVANRAVVTYFGTSGPKARRRAAKSKRRTRRAVDSSEFRSDCEAAGWRVARDRAVIPLWSEQRFAVLARE
ncbi:MAG: class I SAM-dependent methyltransferase, partial [Planctomycetota bacterium]